MENKTLTYYITFYLSNFLSLTLITILFGGISGNLFGIIIASIVFSTAGLVVTPILQILVLPITILTFGFFYFIMNVIMFYISLSVSPGFYIHGLGTTILGYIVFYIFSTILWNGLLGKGSRNNSKKQQGAYAYEWYPNSAHRGSGYRHSKNTNVIDVEAKESDQDKK